MKELSKQFWKETSKLIDAHRKNNDERAAQGVVDSRIVFSKLVKKLTLTDVGNCPFEAYAVFCIECDRKGIKPIKHKDYLNLG
jgi:hypothetical protein